ncbi:MAG: hypothetical protein ACRDK7_01410, partial [Solirubrobacteraceae bacterium]
SNFTCTDGGGPGIASCLDQNGHPSGQEIETSKLGVHEYVVTATSKDGLTATASVVYTVYSPYTPVVTSTTTTTTSTAATVTSTPTTSTASSGPAPSRSARAAAGGSVFTLTIPGGGCIASGRQLAVTVNRSGSGKTYRVLGYSYVVGGRVVARTSGAAARKDRQLTTYIALKGLRAGTQKLTVVIHLAATGKARRGPRDARRSLRLNVNVATC